MPPLEEHIRKSLDQTGKEYREVHEWIDDPTHKYERHHIPKIIEYSMRHGVSGLTGTPV